MQPVTEIPFRIVCLLDWGPRRYHDDSKGTVSLRLAFDLDGVFADPRRLGIGSVSSVAECLSVLDEADRVKRGGGRILDTFRRLRGLGGVAVRER